MSSYNSLQITVAPCHTNNELTHEEICKYLVTYQENPELLYDVTDLREWGDERYENLNRNFNYLFDIFHDIAIYIYIDITCINIVCMDDSIQDIISSILNYLHKERNNACTIQSIDNNTTIFCDGSHCYNIYQCSLPEYLKKQFAYNPWVLYKGRILTDTIGFLYTLA